MPKYINADDLIAQYKYKIGHNVAKVAKRFPAADVRENVRGEWVEDELGTTVCSNCKNPRRDNRIKHIAFCNSCGADMRGQSE